MASVEASAIVPIAPDLAFAVSQTTGDVRYRWDPFVHEQHLLRSPSGVWFSAGSFAAGWPGTCAAAATTWCSRPPAARSTPPVDQRQPSR